MKKKNIFILIVLLCIMSVPNVKAKTIATLKEELKKQQDELNESTENKKLTESQMSNINNNISSIQATITENYKKIDNLNSEIEQLNKDILEKQEEIKKIVNFAQVSNDDSAYLEYVFGASDFTDLIYRSAVAEQLSSYNNKLIDEYNKKITDNKKKTEEIAKQKEELDKKQKSLESQYSSLGNQLSELVDTQVDIKDAIKQQEQLIKDYQKMGCGENEDVQACLKRKNTLPPDTKFWRPLISARITSRFGWRTLYGRDNLHDGIDMSASIGTPVYSIANGVVISTYEVGTTGKAIYINHSVNGKKYTSIYMHLSRYNVKPGDVVTKDTIIAYSGNTGGSTGPHLHLGVLTGYAGVDYRLWSSTFYTKFIDPASVVNFPKGYGSFNNRTSYYK